MRSRNPQSMLEAAVRSFQFEDDRRNATKAARASSQQAAKRTDPSEHLLGTEV
ncbi:hypothetical protein JOF56_003014 [Kibdelosporangium banguiense]|uniref:Uncharacterized protein n=1 Tax=Kibdelosporangium banguiense TaxID=1365924 RepID=A0ABS4TF73_9PSEU|nr:hypothetical protein [Kibdelosporangium banguiense]